jgi:hypothetical protein
MKNMKIIPQRQKTLRLKIISMGNYIPKMKNAKSYPKDENSQDQK